MSEGIGEKGDCEDSGEEAIDTGDAEEKEVVIWESVIASCDSSSIRGRFLACVEDVEGESSFGLFLSVVNAK